MNSLFRNPLLLLITLASPSVHAASEYGDLKPLKEFVEQNDFTTNPEVVHKVFVRCASLYLFLSVVAHRDAIHKHQAATFGIWGEDFLTAMSQSESGATIARTEVFPLMAEYRKRFIKTPNGGLLDDPLIQSDMSFCSTLTPRMETQ